MEDESDNIKENNGNKITKLNESEYIEDNSPSVVRINIYLNKYYIIIYLL